MAMTSYTKNYAFHEQTLSDRVQRVTNSTTRTLKQHELVYISGYFGNVLDPNGIVAGAAGYIDFGSDRVLRTEQVAAAGLMAGDFTVGNTVFFIPQVDANEGYLVDQNVDAHPAVAVGIIVAAASDNSWIEFRPFVQSTDLALVRDADGTIAGIVADVAKKLYVHVEAITADATGGKAIATTSVPEGAVITDVHVISTATNGDATLKLSHTGGADITGAIAATPVNALARTTSLIAGTVTATGLTVTAHGAADRGKVVISYMA